MKLFNQFNSTVNSLNRVAVAEDDGGGMAISACNIAACPTSLLSKVISRSHPNKSPKVINFGSKRYNRPTKNKITEHTLLHLFKVAEGFGPDKGNDGFDTTSVLSKLKNLENKESVDYRDTVTFGLVDTNGGIIKVTVPRDQSAGFEQDLHHFLGEYRESDPTPEIAEVLFKLKNNYNIINVEWPDSIEDAEESSEYQPNKHGDDNEDTEFPPDDDELDPSAAPLSTDSLSTDSASTDKVTDLLTQVIDMMKADADARKSEAQAREAEAKTHQANSARQQAMARVKQEEQFLDMDSYQKNQKDKDKEAKRLAQLAKWKHDLSTDNENSRPAQEPQYDFLPGDENEEYAKLGRGYRHMEDEEYMYPKTPTRSPAKSNDIVRGKVQPSDIAKFIMSRVKQ
jgi:hypothetical protein